MQRLRHLLPVLALAALPAFAQVGVGPRPARAAAPIPAPRDLPFKGRIELAVTATDTAHKVFAVHETIPVQRAGALVLFYPQWEAGSHAATA